MLRGGSPALLSARDIADQSALRLLPNPIALLRSKRRPAFVPASPANQYYLRGKGHGRAPAPSESSPAPKIHWARDRGRQIQARRFQSRQISRDLSKHFFPKSTDQHRIGSSTDRRSAPPLRSLRARCNPHPQIPAPTRAAPLERRNSCRTQLFPPVVWGSRLPRSLPRRAHTLATP